MVFNEKVFRGEAVKCAAGVVEIGGKPLSSAGCWRKRLLFCRNEGVVFRDV